MSLVLKLPVMFNQSAKLYSSSQCNLLVDLFVARDEQECSHVTRLALVVINELFTLLAKILLGRHAHLQTLVQLVCKL